MHFYALHFIYMFIFLTRKKATEALVQEISDWRGAISRLPFLKNMSKIKIFLAAAGNIRPKLVIRKNQIKFKAFLFF